MKRKVLRAVFMSLVIVASILTTKSSFCEENRRNSINLVGTYAATIESIDAVEGYYTESRTMVITEQTGGTFKGYFLDGDLDSFNGVVLRRRISFSHCDSSSFGFVRRNLQGKIVIEVLNAGRDSDYSDYWSCILIAIKQD